MRFIGFYNYTVILTYLSLISGVIGTKCAYDGRLGAAVCCLMFSGICDMFDGAVARSKTDRSADEKNFGIQLDSLCDVICFGVFPAVYLYFSGVNTTYGVAILIFYILCAVIRLAFFNVLETKRQMTETGCAKCYRGLPVTSTAIIFPFFYVLSLFLNATLVTFINYILPLLIGILFIADIRIPKLDVTKLLHIKSKKEDDRKQELYSESASDAIPSSDKR